MHFPASGREWLGFGGQELVPRHFDVCTSPSRKARYLVRDLSSIHNPVMTDRVLALLAPALEREGAVHVDATVGMGGHAEAVLTAFPGVRLIGIDRDEDALAIARERLEPFGERVVFVHAVFDELAAELDALEINEIDSAFFDLGVSSLQLDQAERGFSYMQDALLDMRMDRSGGRTAAELVAELDERELRDLFRRFGDEPLAGRYAGAIVRERAERPIRTTGQLVDVLQTATPAAKRHSGHPAKRVFQALRIAVNGELDALAAALPQAIDRVGVGGRIVVEAYQSLEDRFVKRTFVEASSSSAPAGLPMLPEAYEPQFRLLTRGAEQAELAETDQNPRAKPVRLRAIERIRRSA